MCSRLCSIFLIAVSMAATYACISTPHCLHAPEDTANVRSEWLMYRIHKDEMLAIIDKLIVETRKDPNQIPMDHEKQEFLNVYRDGDVIWYFFMPREFREAYLNKHTGQTIWVEGYVVLRKCELIYELPIKGDNKKWHGT